MEVFETKLEGCLIIKNKVFEDERGIFQETYNKSNFLSVTGLEVNFVQDNLSVSKKGVLRGLHFQKEPYAQAKLIRVLKGEVMDVVVDLRKNSKTFGEHIKLKINATGGDSVFIPKGMAHGFLCISDEVLFHYKCDSFYEPQAEEGIRFDDPELAIDWGYPSEKTIVSKKDNQLPYLKSLSL